MGLTLGIAKQRLHRFITPDGPSDPKVVDIINFAAERLSKSGTWKETLVEAVFPLQQNPFDKTWFITTPGEIEAIHRVVAVCDYPFGVGKPIEIKSQWYSYSLSSVGRLSSEGANSITIQALPGTYATFAIPKKPSYIEVSFDFDDFFVNAIDVSLFLKTTNGQNFFHEGREGLHGSVGYYAPFDTIGEVNLKFSDVYRFIKEQSPLPLKMVAYDESGYSELIGYYEPNEIAPSYRRYRVTGFENHIPENRPAIVGLCSRKFVTLQNDSDAIYPSNLNALRYAVQAVVYEEANDLERAHVYWNMAFRMLEEENQQNIMGEITHVDIQIPAFTSFRNPL